MKFGKLISRCNSLFFGDVARTKGVPFPFSLFITKDHPTVWYTNSHLGSVCFNLQYFLEIFFPIFRCMVRSKIVVKLKIFSVD
jgi:hypothetical protein